MEAMPRRRCSSHALASHHSHRTTPAARCVDDCFRGGWAQVCAIDAPPPPSHHDPEPPPWDTWTTGRRRRERSNEEMQRRRWGLRERPREGNGERWSRHPQKAVSCGGPEDPDRAVASRDVNTTLVSQINYSANRDYNHGFTDSSHYRGEMN